MSDGMTLDVVGTRATAAAFTALPERSQRHVMRPAVHKVATEISKTAKQNVKDTRKTVARSEKGRKIKGLFEKSIGVRMRTYPEAQLILAIVGSRKSSQFRGRHKLAHLIEEGWRIARGGTLARTSGRAASKSTRTGKAGQGMSVGRVPGRHPMKRAYDAHKHSAKAKLETETAKGIEREAAKLNAG
jgi:hypothetical protein